MNMDTQALMMGYAAMVIMGWLFILVLLWVAVKRTWQFYIGVMVAIALREQAKKWQASYPEQTVMRPTRRGMS